MILGILTEIWNITAEASPYLLFGFLLAGLIRSVFNEEQIKKKLEISADYFPFLAGFFAYYVKLSLKPNSSVQTPEKLYREYGFVVYACALLILFLLLIFSHIPFLYDIFNVVPYKLSPLWTF